MLGDSGDYVALDAAVQEARSSGWAPVELSLERILALGTTAGAEAVPTRPGGSPIGRLETAPASGLPSLTREFGLAAFPLHTDGAHLERPPDFVCLAAATADGSGAATTLLPLADIGKSSRFAAALDHGVFRLRRRTGARYLLARFEDGIRYDPACMVPVTDDARYVARVLAESSALARPWRWAGRPTALLLDNRRALHGREPATWSGRVLHRLMLRWEYP